MLHLRGAVVGHVVLVVLVNLGAFVVVVVILRLPRFGLRGARLEAHGMHRALSQIEELVERGVVFANDALVPLAAHVVHVHVVVVRVVVVARSERKLAAGRLRRVRVFLDQMVVARLPARGADDGETAVFVHGVNRVHAAFEANRAFQRVRARGDCAWAETERRDSIVVVQCSSAAYFEFCSFPITKNAYGIMTLFSVNNNKDEAHNLRTSTAALRLARHTRQAPRLGPATREPVERCAAFAGLST